LKQCKIVYECQPGRPFGNYIGKQDVHAMIQFPTASGPVFYFDIDIVNNFNAGFNVFHFTTEPEDIKVLSKDVANGGDYVSSVHCTPKDLIKRSVVNKILKYGEGLKGFNTIKNIFVS